MEYRSFTPELEVRSISKRLLCGIVVPYGLDTRINDALIERFEAGAFTHQFRAAHRVRLLNYHSNQPGHTILGHAVHMRDDDRACTASSGSPTPGTGTIIWPGRGRHPHRVVHRVPCRPDPPGRPHNRLHPRPHCSRRRSSRRARTGRWRLSRRYAQPCRC